MEMHNRNQSDLLPYEKLAILGIDREKADSLPMEVKEKLMAGEVTPIMQVSINTRNGSIITMPMKLQMTTDKNGAPALIAYLVRAELDRERNKVLNLTQQEAERLARGEVIQKAVNVNGEKTQQYLQLDPETKSVIHRRVTDIKLEQRLRDMGGEKVSVGIDLKEQQGFKLIKGDMKEWERQQKLRYDEIHPEYLGLVMTDKNRWEYQKVVDRQSVERAISLSPSRKETKANSLKL